MRFFKLLLLILMLAIWNVSTSQASEKEIGVSCSSDANATDWDTIAQCSSGTFQRIATFFAGALGINMGSTTPMSSVDIYGNVTIGSSYAGVTAAPTNGAIIQGHVGIGTSTPTSGAALDMLANTNSLALPKGTTGQEPSSPVAGMMRYNTTTSAVEFYNGLAWNQTEPMGGAVGAGYFVLDTNHYNGCMNPFGSYSYSGSTGYITYTSTDHFTTGENITTTGFSPSLWNVTNQTITVVNSTKISFPLPSTPSGNPSTTGTACIGNGGLAQANLDCYYDLTANTSWFGYSEANGEGLLASSHVTAFLCDDSGCNEPDANTTYYFASLGDSSAGGGTMTTGTGGVGPNDDTSFEAVVRFAYPSAVDYWTGRNVGTTNAWPVGSGSQDTGNTCSSWTSASASSNGVASYTYYTGTDRWNDGTNTCNTNGNGLVCMVNP